MDGGTGGSLEGCTRHMADRLSSVQAPAAVLHSCVLCCAILFCAVLYYTLVCRAVLYCCVLCCTTHSCAVLCYTVVCFAVLHCKVLQKDKNVLYWLNCNVLYYNVYNAMWTYVYIYICTPAALWHLWYLPSDLTLLTMATLERKTKTTVSNLNMYEILQAFEPKLFLKPSDLLMPYRVTLKEQLNSRNSVKVSSPSSFYKIFHQLPYALHQYVFSYSNFYSLYHPHNTNKKNHEVILFKCNFTAPKKVVCVY